MKYLSFSLWGDKPIYNVGIIKNAELWKEIYTDWQMIVFHDNTVPEQTLNNLLKLNVKLINMNGTNLYGMFWRFLACNIKDCEYAIFRDADSRISMREKYAVQEWISSGKSLHIMRDHPYHKVPSGTIGLGILGGMWGIKGNIISIIELFNKFPKSIEHKYGNDQSFLKYLYLHFINDNLTHDEFFEKNPFPLERENGRFIGERIDENDQPLTDDYKLL